MLNNTLNTNEIKNSAGVEVEFSRISITGRSTEFAKIGESPAYPIRLKLSHQEIGNGLDRRRRSVLRFEQSGAGTVDPTKPAVAPVYIVMDNPIGNSTDNGLAQGALAMLMSFLCTTGAATTVLFDGTGNGAQALLNGGL